MVRSLQVLTTGRGSFGVHYNVFMHQIVFEVVESMDGGYEASALGYRIHTQGEDLDDLRRMVQDAVRTHFEEGDRSSMVRLRFVREEVQVGIS